MEPVFLTLEEILDLHRRALDEHGGQEGVRDLGLAESAMMTPSASYDGQFLHMTIYEMAAAYAFHLAENQPFIDGNKRVAISAALTFLSMNNIDYEGDRVEQPLYEAMIKIGTHQMSKMQLAELLRQLSDNKSA